MKKLLILGLAFCFVQDQPVKAQYYYYNDRYYDNDVVMEIGATFGIMNAFTDLGGKKGIGKSELEKFKSKLWPLCSCHVQKCAGTPCRGNIWPGRRL